MGGAGVFEPILAQVPSFRDPAMANSFDRRQFLQSALTGAGAVALSACGGGTADSASAAPALEPVPSLVPASGGDIKAVATANTFLSQNGNLAGWEYAFSKIVDDFSGGVFNPYWGSWGRWCSTAVGTRPRSITVW